MSKGVFAFAPFTAGVAGGFMKTGGGIENFHAFVYNMRKVKGESENPAIEAGAL